MVSAALPALTVLTASIERLGQSCASAAGANVMKPAHARAPHDVRNDIATSLECRRSSCSTSLVTFFVGHLGTVGPTSRSRPSRPPSRAHDAPDRGAQATGGAHPALVRRTRPPWPHWQGRKCDDWTLQRELRPNEIFRKDGCRKAHGVAHGA